MINNDILRRVRYALRINDKTMIEIFKLGGMEITLEELTSILAKQEEENFKNCNNRTLDAFLSGLITYKRGARKPSPDAKPIEELSNSAKNVNNHVLRKLRIALNFKSDDMLEAFKLGGIEMSESELSAIFRTPTHKNYREAGDKYVRVFLKGIIEMFRSDR